jgi:hypothetical protein
MFRYFYVQKQYEGNISSWTQLCTNDTYIIFPSQLLYKN